MRKVPNWIEYNMSMACQASTRSKDPKTQVGCYIASADNFPISFGYNGFPPNYPESKEMWMSPDKHQYVIHAEKNAILNAAKVGKPTQGCYMYVTHYPCSGCALVMLAAGITKVFYIKHRGEESVTSGKILELGGVIPQKVGNSDGVSEVFQKIKGQV